MALTPRLKADFIIDKTSDPNTTMFWGFVLFGFFINVMSLKLTNFKAYSRKFLTLPSDTGRRGRKLTSVLRSKFVPSKLSQNLASCSLCLKSGVMNNPKLLLLGLMITHFLGKNRNLNRKSLTKQCEYIW